LRFSEKQKKAQKVNKKIVSKGTVVNIMDKTLHGTVRHCKNNSCELFASLVYYCGWDLLITKTMGTPTALINISAQRSHSSASLLPRGPSTRLEGRTQESPFQELRKEPIEFFDLQRHFPSQADEENVWKRQMVNWLLKPVQCLALLMAFVVVVCVAIGLSLFLFVIYFIPSLLFVVILGGYRLYSHYNNDNDATNANDDRAFALWIITGSVVVVLQNIVTLYRMKENRLFGLFWTDRLYRYPNQLLSTRYSRIATMGCVFSVLLDFAFFYTTIWGWILYAVALDVAYTSETAIRLCLMCVELSVITSIASTYILVGLMVRWA
jgi:hypothetical protein